MNRLSAAVQWLEPCLLQASLLPNDRRSPKESLRLQSRSLTDDLLSWPLLGDEQFVRPPSARRLDPHARRRAHDGMQTVDSGDLNRSGKRGAARSMYPSALPSICVPRGADWTR